MSRENRQRRRRAFNIPGHVHELTFTCYRRFPFLKAERTRRWLAASIERARVKWDFDLWAFVFMPEHVHLIVRPRQVVYEMRQLLSAIKLPVAKRAIRFLEKKKSPWLNRLTRQRGERIERLFWQSGGGFDRNVTEGRTLLQMIDYLHFNPVRRGLVTSATDWFWSSASFYEGGTSPIPIAPITYEWLMDT